jgi:parallel beta-helix repeat protein
MTMMTSIIFAGTVYYVDATYGNDSNNGLSEATAWQTIAKVNRSWFSPGDSILFKRGEVWRESQGLTISGYSGTSGSRITFGAYGSGPKPIINGASIATGWTGSGWGNVYEKNFTYEAMVVVEDDTVLTNVLTWNGSVAATFSGASAGSWSWSGSKCYVWCTDGADPDNHTMEVATKASGLQEGILVTDNNYITFENLEIKYATRYGFLAYAESDADINYIIIQGCDLHGCGASGIAFDNQANANDANHRLISPQVTRNTVYENREHGIIFICEVISGLINHNTVYDNSWEISFGWHGISQYSHTASARPTGNIVEYNTVYGTLSKNPGEGAGIQCDDYTKDSIIRYNICYDNEGDGIRIHRSDGCQVYYNISYNNGSAGTGRSGISTQDSTNNDIYNNVLHDNPYAGIYIGGSEDSDTTIRNNIVFENGNYEMVIEYSARPNFSTDYNCIYHSAGGNFMRYGGTGYNWSVWQGLGHDIYSINQDPLCVNASNDFSLQSSSPCIDAGIDVGITSDFEGTSVPQGYGIDIGAYEYEGPTNPSYTLSIASITGSPAPGSGGTTNPQPGNYSYSQGNSVQVEAIPYTDYRFSKWTGDISGSNAFNSQFTLTMNEDKSITANFFTKCGDVNGDLNVSPADAQTAFDIYLGRISNPTESERENADVNCDGTTTSPNITPADANAIFEKYIGKNELPCNCACSSRTASVFSQTNQTRNVNLIFNNIQGKIENEIVISITVESPININAFGFDLLFPADRFEFVGVEKDELQTDSFVIDANKIAEGVVRAGGYRCSASPGQKIKTLIKLVFRPIGITENLPPFTIMNQVDDIKNAFLSLNLQYTKQDINSNNVLRNILFSQF